MASIHESILARLRHQGRIRGLEPQAMLLLYIQECFLARLSQSRYVDQLVLKGGLSMYARYRAEARPTRDIDLAGLGMPNTPTAVSEVITEIARIEVADGLDFDGQSLQAREILEDAAHTGIRVELWVMLGKSRERLQLDISFGNVITPGPVTLSFPSLLGSVSYPIQGYPLESVLAEKLAAVTELGPGNTRMKDFFDLHWILSQEPLDDHSLRIALHRTFISRGIHPQQLAPTLAILDHPDTQRRWDQFCRNTRVEAPGQISTVLQTIMARFQNLAEMDGSETPRSRD